MAPDPAQGHLQPGSLFLTAPVRRRSTAGCPAGMIHPADAEDSSSTLLGPSSQCQGAQQCCHHAVHVDTHIQQADGCCDVKPSASAASSQLLAGTNNAGGAVRHQGLLLRTSSSGPVTTRIHAAAICCPMESRLIHNILDSVHGVLSVDVMVVTKMVSVHHDPAAISPAALVAALNSAGLQASLNKHSTSGGQEPAAAAGACSSGCCRSTLLPHSSSWQQPLQRRSGVLRLLASLRDNKSLPPLSVMASGLLLLINLLLLLPGIPTPGLLQKGLLALVAAAVAVPPVLRKAYMGLKNRNLDMNSLVVVALFGAVGLGDWFEAGALVVLFTLAEWLEERCVQRAAGAMEDILKLQPEEALVIVNEADSHTAQHISNTQQHQQHQHEAAGSVGADCCSTHGCCDPAGSSHKHQHSCIQQQHGLAQQQHGHEHHGDDHGHEHGACSSSCSSPVPKAASSCCAPGCGDSCSSSSSSSSCCAGHDHSSGSAHEQHSHHGSAGSQHSTGAGGHAHLEDVHVHSCCPHDIHPSACCSHSDVCGHSHHDHDHHHQHEPQQQQKQQQGHKHEVQHLPHDTAGGSCCGHHHHQQHQPSAESTQLRACSHDHGHSCSHEHQHSHDHHQQHQPAASTQPGTCSHDHGDSCSHEHQHSHGHHQQHQPAGSTLHGACSHDHGHSCSDEHQHSHGHDQQHQPAAEATQHKACSHDHSCCHAHSHEHQHSHQHSHSHEHSPALKSVPVSQLPVGVLVLVRPGDKVPVDGTIESGISVLDESMITGESKPVTKTPGSSVLAGTINCGSVALKVRATSAAADSTVARLGALMEAAAASKSRHDMAVELFARYYTPAIVLAALLVAAIGSALQPGDWRHWTYMSLVVLVTGCPCALVISTPVASVAGLTRAAKKGVLIKGGRPLELLGNLKAASFDKSGTLTEGHFQLTKVHTFEPFSKQQALQMAAMLEQHSNHPIAHAIVGAAAAGGCMSSGGAAAALQVTEVAGKGLHGLVDGRAVAVGSWGYAQELLAAAVGLGVAGAAATAEADASAGTKLAGNPAAGQQSHQQHTAVMAEVRQLLSSAGTLGSTVVCLVVEHQLAAVLLLSDRARSDALAAVQELQQLGVTCLMMTGDTMGAAAHIAGQLGIELEDVCAELLPQEKLELISTLRLRLAAAQQRKTQQQRGAAWSRPVQWLAAWRSKQLGVGSSSSSSSNSGFCSSCGEHAGDCSCCVVLGPESSSTRRSSGGGLKGTSASGIHINAAAGLTHAAAAAASNGNKRAASSGVIIAHVGDGINDAPALAGADVGVAMGVAGAALAVDAADVALFSNNLTSLPFVVRLSRRASLVVAVNTVFACSIKLAVLAAAAGGVASLWLSLLADVGSSLLVTLHALTLLRFEAGQEEHGSKLYGSRLSGIPLVGELDAQQSSSESATAGSRAGGLFGLQWLQQLVSRLPGAGFLRPYDKLADRTPGVSAGVSRLNSSNARSGFLGPASSALRLTPKGSAAQELREMAILACATSQGDATGLLRPRGPSDTSSSGGGAEPAAGGCSVQPVPGAHFVIDDECC